MSTPEWRLRLERARAAIEINMTSLRASLDEALAATDEATWVLLEAPARREELCALIGQEILIDYPDGSGAGGILARITDDNEMVLDYGYGFPIRDALVRAASTDDRANGPPQEINP